MLSEAIRRHSRGEDVVIGVVESHGRRPIAELAAQLEAVPRRKREYKGTTFEEMDVDAILARRPQVVVVDELAHTNIEGSKHSKRYQDVMELLDHKIDVLSTMNVQHIESLGPTVQRITGVPVREAVPDWVIQRAGEIVMADLTPEALQTRMRRGDVYPKERIERSLTNFFRLGNLIALRELALRQVAQAVDKTLESYLAAERLERKPAARWRTRSALPRTWGPLWCASRERAWPSRWPPSCAKPISRRWYSVVPRVRAGASIFTSLLSTNFC